MADNKNKTLRPSLNLFFLHSTVLFFLLLLLPSPSHQNPTPDRQKRQAFDFTMNTPSTENNVSNSKGAPGLPPITNAGGLGDLVNSSGTETDDTGTGWPGGSDPTLGGYPGPGIPFSNQPHGSGDNSTGNGLDLYELFGNGSSMFPVNTSSNTFCFPDCGDHGVCNYTDEEKTKSYCVCDQGHVGDFCETPCGRICSNVGSCDKVEKETEGNRIKQEVCVCPYPWVGPYCEDLPPEEVEKGSTTYVDASFQQT